MKRIFTSFFLLLFTLTTSQYLKAQTCSDGSYQWSDVATVFESNGCAVSSCHGTSALGGLDLTTYAGFNTGGTKCADEISVGTTLVDIIQTGASCTGGMVGAMNNNIASPIPQAEIDALQAWVDSGAFEFCRGVAVTEGACDPTSTVSALTAPPQTTLCTDGSDAPTFVAPSASLPDVQIAIEIDGSLFDISSDGSFDTSTLTDGAEICYSGFAFDLAEINTLLSTANTLCGPLDCDVVFGIDGLEAAITELINGDNDGSPGLNNLNEALAFAGSFGTPIQSVQSAASTLVSLNEAIGGFGLGPVCFATTDNVCISATDCSPAEPGVATTEGLCDPASQVDALSVSGQTSLCSDGSDAPTLASASATLPDVQIAVEVNGALIDISADGTFDTSTLNENDEVCYTAFAFNLAAINDLLATANTLCGPLDCDVVFEIAGLEAAITELINGDNDGVPGLNNLNEALTFAGSFGTPIESVLGATTTLISLNEAIGAFGLGPVCFATSDFACLNVVTCAPAEPGVATTEGLCDPASQVDALSLSGQTSLCSNGSDTPTLASASATLPDVQIAVEINGVLIDISADGTFDTSTLNENDEVCYTAFAFNLAAINDLLATANTLCGPLDCDVVFEIAGLEAAITELINGDNDGVPGLNNLNEALTFAGSFGTPIESVLGATTTLVSLNEAIGAFGLGPVCFATSDYVCLPVAVCGPCSGEEAEVIFSVDMSCSGTTARPPVVTGPFNEFSGDGNIMEDPDGDDIWEAVICVVPGTAFEYKYAILNFAEQEDLVDDAIAGATCAPVTDFNSFANRQVTIPAGGGALPTDAYGICGTCADPPVNVTFNIDMSCSGIAPGTQMAFFGGFNGFCCALNMTDSDGDNIWSYTLPFPPDDSGCISMQYLYTTENFGEVEAFLSNGEDIANCPNITSDYYSFANRIVEVCEDVVLDEYWNSCAAPAEPAGGCDDGDCANGVETWDGCTCVAGMAGEIPTCDDGDCTNGLETYNEATCSCDPGTPPVDPGCDDGDCSNGLETWDGCECVAGEAPVDPGCDDGDCSNGVETWDGCECVAGTAPVDPGCDDGDCSNGVETWNGCECVAGTPGETPDCDDGDCSNGIETYDAANCECVAGTAPVDPGCDDGDCTNGTETWDGCECAAGEAPVDPGCDDGDCSNGVETWDGCECVAGTPPADPGCDDGDCSNGVETWNGCECVAGTPGETPDCDDGNCANGLETYNAETCSCDPGTPPDDTCPEDTCFEIYTWDAGTCECIVAVVDYNCDDENECTTDSVDETTCECVNTPIEDCGDVEGCTDACAPNYDATATVDDGSCEAYSSDCNTDCSMGDIEVWNAESCSCEIETIVVSGCTDSNASNFNPDANCDDGTCVDASCVPPTPGEIDCE